MTPDLMERQKQFFHWNYLLEDACNQSVDVITQKLYHGVNKPLMPSTYSGTYYGPISTTTIFHIAKQFAGSNGRILELYPAFSKRGLRVSWLSNFPDEDEVLYMNVTFQIVNIFQNFAFRNTYTPFPVEASKTDEEQTANPVERSPDSTDSEGNEDEEEEEKVPASAHKEEERTNNQSTFPLRQLSADKHTSIFFEKCIMKAIQMINVNSKVISFNCTQIDTKKIHDRDADESKTDDYELDGFSKLNSSEQIAVLYLLYLQYKRPEWDWFVQQVPKYIHVALSRYRDQFIALATSVEAVKMEHASILIQDFFARVHLNEYAFPGKYAAKSQTHADSEKKRMWNMVTNSEKRRYIVNLATFCKLFPKCKQVLINGENFDWSLDRFIAFLSKYKLNYSRVALQDIHIRFGDGNEDTAYSEKLAKKKIREMDAKLDELSKLGWQFVSGTRLHLHRYGFQPHPELPFLSLFINTNNVEMLDSSYVSGVQGRKPHNKWTLQDLFNTSSSSIFSPGNNNRSRSRLQFLPTIRSGDIYNNDGDVELGGSGNNSRRTTHTSRQSMSYQSEGQVPEYMRNRTNSNASSRFGTEGADVSVVAYNARVCDLSRDVFHKYSRAEQIEIAALLEYRLQGGSSSDLEQKQVDSDSDIDESQQKRRLLFDRLCRNIEYLVLDPMPFALRRIFMTAAQRKRISFRNIICIFPNVQDVFLKNTRFSLRIWYDLLKTIQQFETEEKKDEHEERKLRMFRRNSAGPGAAFKCKLTRIFFSKKHEFSHKYMKIQDLRFKPHGWKFQSKEQVLFRVSR